jgi:hypothetical protein
MTIAYLKEHNASLINEMQNYANNKGLKIDTFIIGNRNLKIIPQEKDILVIANLDAEIVTIANALFYCYDNKLILYSMKEDFCFDKTDTNSTEIDLSKEITLLYKKKQGKDEP